jgi:hypothetical protein
MAVQRNLGTNPIAVAAVDTTLLTAAGTNNRHVTGSLLAYNSTGAGITVSVYDSPDLTSASGTLISTEIVPANGSMVFTDLVSVGFADDRNIIAVASGAGVDAKLTYTLFTDGS